MLTLVVTGGRKMLQIFLKVLERQTIFQTIFQLYIHDNKSKYSGNPKGILKSAKKKTMKISTSSKLSQLLLLNF